MTFETDRKKFHYIRLEPDGHLNIYQLANGYVENFDLSRDEHYGNCIYPIKFGNYRVCSDEQCSCPGSSSYFKESIDKDNGFSCIEITHLTCQDKQLQHFLKLENVTYFQFNPYLFNVDVESCKRECLRNMQSCLVLIRRKPLYWQLFFTNRTSYSEESKKEISCYNDITFIKVQKPLYQNNMSPLFLLVSSVSAFLLLITGASITFYVRWRNRRRRTNSNEESLVHVATHLRKL